ncbi:KH domain-containing protein 3 [Microtus ochrogaster]|uniref:KH domain-containing protein 3 n=1 Tax=Microtus ochrogaster TaxID=79684 RepID=A0A8J6GCZ1_MICOH|nr:KH domain-containing protein 3 [Microtus ochrogaster]
MVPFKTYKSLVQLKHKEGTLFEVVGDSSMLPKWFRTEYLDDPKTVYVNPWFVEVIFGKDGWYIPHFEITSRTLLQVTHWRPEEDAEILIFGPSHYRKDVSPHGPKGDCPYRSPSTAFLLTQRRTFLQRMRPSVFLRRLMRPPPSCLL